MAIFGSFMWGDVFKQVARMPRLIQQGFYKFVGGFLMVFDRFWMVINHG